MPQFRLPAATWWAAGERASSDIALAKPACRAPSVAPTCALHALFQACCSTWHSSGGKLRPVGRYFFFAIFILGNFRLTAATTAACSGLPELLANASRAWAASGIGYFLAPFSTKSDFGSFFLFAAVSLATINVSPLEWRRRPAARAASRQSNCKGPPGLPCAVTPRGTWPLSIPSNQNLIIRIYNTSVCSVVNRRLAHP